MSNEKTHVSITFYQWQFTSTLIWWVIVRVVMKKHLYDVTNGSVFTRPSWLSSRVLHRLQAPDKRRFIFLASLLALFLGGWIKRFYIRCVVAFVISLYHLLESSVTHRHGEYPLLYNAWVMCLPSQYASAASWGIAIHFVLSTGLAKLQVGGKQWMDAPTMKFYLNSYYRSKTSLNRPFLPILNQWACRRSWATKFMSISTIFLECGVTPFTLFLPSNKRWVATAGMIFMHIGIFILMSKKVGIVFATTLPTYVIGFSCTVEFGTVAWWCAVAIAFLPNILFVSCKGLPENWPSSPVSLFMWSGNQAKTLADALMSNDTRLVLGTSDKSPDTIVGLPVLHHGSIAPVSQHKEADRAVHDCVLRVIGYTILHHQLMETVPSKLGTKEDWDVHAFVQNVQRFLESDMRLFETQSGQPLVNAYYVRLDGHGNVKEVIK